MNSILNTGDQATHAVKQAASLARENFLEFGTQLVKLLGRMREAEGRGADSLLEHMGLQRRTGLAKPVVCFAAGAIVGAGAALLLAPTAGDKLRKKLAAFFSTEIDQVTSPVKPLVTAAEQSAEEAEVVAKKADNGAKHHVTR
jgi:hypothetical protein